jgi:hypothetical protein
MLDTGFKYRCTSVENKKFKGFSFFEKIEKRPSKVFRSILGLRPCGGPQGLPAAHEDRGRYAQGHRGNLSGSL